jgi:hypothetical protein
MDAYTKINLKEIGAGGTGEVEARFARSGRSGSCRLHLPG